MQRKSESISATPPYSRLSKRDSMVDKSIGCVIIVENLHFIQNIGSVHHCTLSLTYRPPWADSANKCMTVTSL